MSARSFIAAGHHALVVCRRLICGCLGSTAGSPQIDRLGASLRSDPRHPSAIIALLLGAALLAGVLGCQNRGAAPAAPQAAILHIEPGPEAQHRVQSALIEVEPGGTIEFAAGTFDFTMTLSLDVAGVTLRGQGPDATVFSFRDQQPGGGGEGLLVTGDGALIEDLAVVDPKGDALKVMEAEGITLRRVRAEWTDGPSSENGGYGLYPVLCRDVLVEDCVAIGASDAGIYVGQSENILVRRNRAERNVAGIEIENSVDADVYENVSENNTGGILVFTLPDLPKKQGKRCRVFNNRIVSNNHANFAPPGNIVGEVPPGTGLMLMATDDVEVFGNTIEDHETANLSIISYLVVGKPIKDAKYDPFCEAIYIHDNHFARGGAAPQGPLGTIVKLLLGTDVPDILYDGIVDPAKLVDGQLPPDRRICVRNNGEAGFANVDLGRLDVDFDHFDVGQFAALLLTGMPRVSRDLAPHDAELPPLAGVTIEGVK